MERSGVEVENDSIALNKYFPTTLVNRKTAARQRKREQQAEQVDSDSDITQSSSSDIDSDDFDVFPQSFPSSREVEMSDDDDDDDNGKTSRFKQLALQSKQSNNKETETMLHRKKRRSKKERQRIACLVARKEHAEQTRRRNREMFEEYASTILYAVLSVGITFLVLYFIGYSKNVQPIISAQLWLVFGIGLVVVLLFIAEAFFATRPLFVRINSAFSSAARAAARSGGIKSNSQRRRGGEEEEGDDSSALTVEPQPSSADTSTNQGRSFPSTSIEINPLNEARNSGGGGINIESTSAEDAFRSPKVARRDMNDLSEEDLHNLGMTRSASNGKLSPFSALEAN